MQNVVNFIIFLTKDDNDQAELDKEVPSSKAIINIVVNINI